MLASSPSADVSINKDQNRFELRLNGDLVGIVGFFVIPVVGLFIGFIAGVYVAEVPRHRNHSEAWRSTVHATKAAGLSILVELFGALLASAVWLGGALFV